MTTSINEFGLPNLVIPAEVHFNKNLKKGDGILFGIILNLTHNQYGYCWASNKYLSVIAERSVGEVAKGISRLKEQEYITTEYVRRKKDGREIRKIYIDYDYPKKYGGMLRKKHQEIESFKTDDDEEIIVKKTNKKEEYPPCRNEQGGVVEMNKGGLSKSTSNIESQYSEHDLENVVSKDTTNSFLEKSSERSTSRKRKRKSSPHKEEASTDSSEERSKTSMKDKIKQKASNKAPKHKSSPKYETKTNVAAINLWNEYCASNKAWQRCLIKPDSKTYRRTLQKLHELFNGLLSYDEDQLINKKVAPYLSKKFTFNMFRKSLEVLNKKLDPKYLPQNKDWMKGLSLQSAIMNYSGSAANLHEAYYFGLHEKYQPGQELKTDEQKKAFDILEKHFKNYSDLDIPPKKIVNLVKKIDEDYYVVSFARDITEALTGDEELSSALYNDFGFKLIRSKHSPNSLYPGKATFNTINEAYKHVYDSELLKRKPTESERKAQEQAEKAQAVRRRHEELLFKIQAMESKGKLELIELVDNSDEVIGIEANGIQIAKKNGKGYLEINDDVEVKEDTILVGQKYIC